PPKSRTRTSSVACDGAIPSTSTSSGSAPETLRSGTWTRAWVSSEAALAASVIRDRDPHCDRGSSIGAHADRLLALELLALRHQRRGNHHLRAVELRDVGIAGGGHRGPERPDQIEGAVVLLGRAEDDLLEGAVLLGRDPRPPRERGMEGRHPPVI